jgi:CheY-like chemotaxis protein
MWNSLAILLLQENLAVRVQGQILTKPRVLLVDDNEDLREVYQEGLEKRGLEVVTASSAKEALGRITAESFDVLLSDLHMPDAGDGMTVVSAMRHAHPKAVTIVLSGYPAMQEAMSAILLQADEVVVKPVGVAAITELIQMKLANPVDRRPPTTESVASILERDLDATIQNWMALVDQNDELTCIPLSYEERTGHLPRLLRDLIRRLRFSPAIKALESIAAREHGDLRRKQGYTAPMVVEESRMLQVSVFATLQNNLRFVDFSRVLLDVMTIADEVDSQLKQAMLSYVSTTSARSVV